MLHRKFYTNPHVNDVDSTTEGHSHLHIDVPMSWRRYRKLLRQLDKAGIIETRYRQHSERRGAMFLRPPHHTKGWGHRSKYEISTRVSDLVRHDLASRFDVRR